MNSSIENLSSNNRSSSSNTNTNIGSGLNNCAAEAAAIAANVNQTSAIINISDKNVEQIEINDPNVPKPALRGAICKGNLYLNLLNIPPGDYSKELFITLLDKAEEAGCNNVIVCLDKQTSIRPFGFLGFKLLSPDHPLAPSDCSEKMLFMCYELEGTNSL